MGRCDRERYWPNRAGPVRRVLTVPVVVRSDGELLLAHLRGDRYAFAELVDRHAGVLWTVALRTLRDERDAAEVVQDALVRAHQHAADYRGEATVRGWLVRIVVNACRDRYRRAGSRPVEVRDELALLRVPAPRDPIADHDLRMDLRDALGALPLEQRMVVVLVTMLGYPTEEVADMLGIAVGTVKSRGARARAVLAEALADRAPAPRMAGGDR
jgi:RNA polymerase sigma-70 factor (ECF subfamily)